MKKNINILVVDNDPECIRDAWSVLNNEGYTVEGLLSGKEAMRKIEQYNYDIVFTGLALPDTGGISLVRWIRQFRPAIGIVVIAEHAMQETIKEAHRVGIISHMKKPFTPAVLRDVTNKAIEVLRAGATGEGAEEEIPPAKLAELDKVIHQYRKKSDSTMMVLLHAQRIFGHLSSVIQERIARGLNIYPSEIRSIVSFYSCFRTKPGGDDTECYINGSGRPQRGVPWKTGRRVADAVNEFLRWKQLNDREPASASAHQE